MHGKDARLIKRTHATPSRVEGDDMDTDTDQQLARVGAAAAPSANGQSTGSAAGLGPGAAGLPFAGAQIGRVAAPIRDQVLDVVRQGILDFQLKPGQRLIERELIEQLGVSRATVREVLSRLVAEGLVTVQPQHGAVVAVLSPEEAEDIYEMRVPLEVLVMQRFVKRATDEEVDELRAALAKVEAITGGETDMQTRLKVKDDFYRIIFDGARSPTLAQTLQAMQGRIRLLRATSLSAPGRPQAALQELQALVEAIAARDIDKVTKAATNHVRNSRDTALTRLTHQEEPVKKTRRKR
jgi:DNA-binding GntR family transcriptional regulator